MSMGHHLNRERGNLLPRAVNTERPKPCVKFTMDVEHYKRTGEVIPITEPEEYAPPPTEITDWGRNYPQEIETEGKDMPKKKELKPSREQLIEDRATMSLHEIAKKYSCGISTVSFWIKEYGMQSQGNRAAAGAPKKEQHDIPAQYQAIKDEIENSNEPAIIIATDDTEELWRLVEENISIIRQQKVAAVDGEIKERLLGMIGR